MKRFEQYPAVETDIGKHGAAMAIGLSWMPPAPEVPTAMVAPSSLHAMECKGRLAPTDAATLLDRRSSSISCSSKPADANTCDAVRKLTELAAACTHKL